MLAINWKGGGMSMQKIIAIVLVLTCLCGMIGCTTSGSETDYPAAIMVDGEVYYLVSEPTTGEVHDSAILGHTSSYTDTFPQKDGETNFNRELEMPYAKVTEGIAVFYENEWHLCAPED